MPTNLIVKYMVKTIKPTEGELEILQVLWDKGEATVREVHEELLLSKECGYTTTLKLMQIMYEKKIVERDDSSRTHIYKPVISKQQTQEQMVDKMVHSLFSGSHTQLVMQALGSHKPTDDEIKAIQNLLNNYKSTKS